MGNRLLLIDAYSQIYRAYYALRQLTTPDGTPVNAVYGVLKMLRKLLAEQQPTHAAMVYDLGAPRQRLAVLPTYKEQRPPTPPGLETQLPIIRDLLAALRLAIVEQEGEEADDLIATLATQADHAGWDVRIASSDKDFTQLVNERIRLVRAESNQMVVVDPATIRQRYGLRPDQMVDYFCLVGDSVDNIPGVPGIGEKTAVALLQTHDTVERLLAAAASLPKEKLRQALLQSTERLALNRQLIALRCDLPHVPPLETLRAQPADKGQLRELCAVLGFKSLLAELAAPATPDLFGHR